MPHPPRYLELDLLRSLAVLCMIVYHGAYDLMAFYGWEIDVFSGGWLVLQRATAGTFLLLVGIGFAISWNRGNRRYGKYLRRGLGLLACGLLVSIVTYVIDPQTFVRFGILHLIGTAILLLPFFTRLREGTAIIGLSLLFLGPSLARLSVETPLFVPIGVTPVGFQSVDYFPLIPWFGIVLIGYAMGGIAYVYATAWRRHLPPRPVGGDLLAWPGRHALWIYLAHQPVLIVLLGLILGWPF